MDLLRELVEYPLKVLRQRALERHPAAVGGMGERQPCRVQKRTREMRYGPKVAGHAPPDAAVQRVPDNRMTDGAQVDSDLVRSPGVNGDAGQRQHFSEL